VVLPCLAVIAFLAYRRYQTRGMVRTTVSLTPNTKEIQLDVALEQDIESPPIKPQSEIITPLTPISKRIKPDVLLDQNKESSSIKPRTESTTPILPILKKDKPDQNLESSTVKPRTENTTQSPILKQNKQNTSSNMESLPAKQRSATLRPILKNKVEDPSDQQIGPSLLKPRADSTASLKNRSPTSTQSPGRPRTPSRPLPPVPTTKTEESVKSTTQLSGVPANRPKPSNPRPANARRLSNTHSLRHVSPQLIKSDWEEYYTDQGEKYFYNTKTGASAWQIPENS